MRFTDIFIRRPILAVVVNLLILLVGGASLFLLNTREYPNMESATIQVTTRYPGATHEVRQDFVPTPSSAISLFIGATLPNVTPTTAGHSRIRAPPHLHCFFPLISFLSIFQKDYR